MLTRAYSTLDVKAVDEAQRIVEGIASTPSVDRMDDIVEPMGAEFKLPMPFLLRHDSRLPVGHVIAAKPQKSGIPVRIQILSTDTPGSVKDRLDSAWEEIRLGLVRGLSIGFKAIESVDIEGTWGTRYTKWQWLELSAVTIPANADASITAIKSADALVLAALGHKDPDVARTTPPGASGRSFRATQPKLIRSGTYHGHRSQDS